MDLSVPQILRKTFLLIVIFSLVLANARPNHFQENTQLTSPDQDSNNLVENGLIQLLIQKMAEMNDNGFERNLRAADLKRQSRYRQCYFNPISCFKK